MKPKSQHGSRLHRYKGQRFAKPAPKVEPQPDTCPNCRGGSGEGIYWCPVCKGSGVIYD